MKKKTPMDTINQFQLNDFLQAKQTYNCIKNKIGINKKKNENKNYVNTQTH